MEKKQFNEPEINVTLIEENDAISTSGGVVLPDDWWN